MTAAITMNTSEKKLAKSSDKCSGMLYFLGDIVVFGPMKAIEILVNDGMEYAAASRYVTQLKADFINKEDM